MFKIFSRLSRRRSSNLRAVQGSRSLSIESLEERALLAATRFAVIGDYGAADPREADVAALVKSSNPDLILTVGDNNFPTGAASTIDINVGQYYHDYIFPYLGSYGAGAATNRFFPTLGNRDWGNTYPNPNGAQPYLDYFTLPGNERYYTFTNGPVQFFALDSDPNEPDGTLPTSTQGNWLKEQLAASTATYKIVYFHHPPYSSTSWSESADMRWPFQAWGATAVVTANAHNYERLIEDNNFPYFVNGLGGNDAIDPYDEIEAGSQVRYNGDNGALIVTADETQMQFQFITRTGVVVDTYTIPAPTPKVLTTVVPTGAVWKYLDNGSNQGTAWQGTSFDDSAWSSGPAQLGYGDGDEQTVVGYGPESSDKYITTYFRKTFDVPDPSVAADGLTLTLMRDDGAVVYLNGIEVLRNNLPSGTIGYRELASSSIFENESALLSFTINPALLVAGTNVLAVEIHQSDTSSPDISFDLGLIGSRILVTNTTSSLGLAGFPSPIQAGVAGNFTVTALDANGNTATGYRGTIHFTSSDPQAELPADYTFTAADNGTHIFSAMLKTSGAQSLVATDTATGTIAGSQSVTVQANAASILQVAGLPSSIQANVAGNFTITALDAFGNTATGYRGTIHFTSSDSQAVLPADYTFTAADNGTHTFSATLKTPGSRSIVATDTVTNTVTGSQTVTVESVPVSTTLISAGSTWKYLDNGTNQGTAWRAAAFNDAAWASGAAQLGYGDGDEQTTVGFGSASNRYITTYFRKSFVVADPSFAANGLILNLLRDDGAVVYLNGTEVFRSNMPNGTIGYQTAASSSINDADESKFYSATINPALLVAGSNVLAVEIHQWDSSSTDISFNLSLTVADTPTPAVASSLRLASFPSPAQAGVAGNFTVTALDGSGATVPGYRGTIHFTSSDPQAVLPPDYTFTAADNGTHTFSATLKTSGTQSLVATDTATGAVTGSQTVTVKPAVASSLRVGGFSSSTQADQAIQPIIPIQATATSNFTITVLDAYGNIAAGYRGTVHFSSSDNQAVLPDDYTFTEQDAGVHSFTATLKTPGSQSLTVTDTSNSSITGTQTIPAPVVTASSVRVSGFPSPTKAGASGKFTVTILDAGGNVVTGYRGTITFKSSDSRADLPSKYTFTAGDKGVHTFSATLKTAGSQSLTATDNDNSSLSGTQTITVQLATTSSLRVSGFQSPAKAGTSGKFTVTVVDAGGNVSTGYRGTMKFTSSDSRAGLPSKYTFTASDKGVHTFSATFKTAGNQTLTATDSNTSAINGTQKIDVNPAAAVSFVVTEFPLVLKTGIAKSFVVTARDAYGNIDTNYRGMVKFKSSDNRAELPKNYKFTDGDCGVHTFSVKLKTVGIQWVTVTDSGKQSITDKKTALVLWF